MIDNHTIKTTALVRMSERHEIHTRKLNVRLHEVAKEDFLVAVSHFVKWSVTIVAYLRNANNIVLEMEDVKDAEIIINVHKLFPLTRGIILHTTSVLLSLEIAELLEEVDIPFTEI
nr:hypothetical protein CFP56_36825 [Quercus suber]